MAERGGSKPGERRGGRQKGAKNKKNIEKIEELSRSGLTPLEYMLGVMRDETADKSRRDDMAGKAAPYMHPRLQAAVNPTDPTKPPVTRLEVEIVSSGQTGS